MCQPISAESFITPATKTPYRNVHASALDALANFWFTQIKFTDAGDRERPEMNMEMSADLALACCLKPYGIINEQSCISGSFEDGFNVGLRVASVLVEQPFNADVSLRAVLSELLVMTRERQ